LRGVSVRRGGEMVLRGLDLTIPGGAAVALVGKSGAGKSTLAQLAGRLADPDAGRVTLDGTDLRDLTRDGLRTAVVYAFDRPSLDTVTEMQVSRALTERLGGRTRLIVAHRAATAARADLVAWLDDGQIRALAPHEQLWRDAGYRALFGC